MNFMKPFWSVIITAGICGAVAALLSAVSYRNGYEAGEQSIQCHKPTMSEQVEALKKEQL